MAEPAGRPAPRTATAVVEDYLKVVYSHTEWQDDPITPSQLAGRLGLAPSSVTETVKKLSAQGLVRHAPYGAIELTAAGRVEALRMVRRHRLVETWLVSVFGYGWDEVHDEAEVLEHTLSDRLLEAIDEQLGRPGRDPHGDPIPDAAGEVRMPDARPLSTLDRGARGTVVRISDRDAELLRRVADRGVALDSVVVAGELPPDDESQIWVVVD